MNELAVGTIAGPFGVRGELKCDPSNSGRTIFSPGAELHCRIGERSQMVRVVQARAHKGRLLLRIEGVDDADAAKAYAGATLYAPRERIELQSGEYLDADLVGCEVVGPDGAAYGTVERVEHMPSSDMLVVGGRLVPMVRAIVTGIDMQARRVTIDPPAGLMDDDALA